MEFGLRVAGILSYAVAAIPFLLVGLVIVWRAIRSPARGWVPFLTVLGLFLLVQGCVAIVDPAAVTAILYLMAGAGKNL